MEHVLGMHFCCFAVADLSLEPCVALHIPQASSRTGHLLRPYSAQMRAHARFQADAMLDAIDIAFTHNQIKEYVATCDSNVHARLEAYEKMQGEASPTCRQPPKSHATNEKAMGEAT